MPLLTLNNSFKGLSFATPAFEIHVQRKILMKSLLVFLFLNFLSVISSAGVSPLPSLISSGYATYADSCIEVACNYTSDCSLDADLDQYVRACRYVDGGCVREICNQKGCGLKNDVLRAIELCRGADSFCVQQGCFYGHCSFETDIKVVTNACQRYVDSDCLRNLCSRRGDCDFRDRFVKYARLCTLW
jgi:hypothetical protein